MYLNGYDSGLAGFRQKFRKLAKVAGHVGAAVATGGASLAISAAYINAQRQKKMQAQAAADAARQNEVYMQALNTPQPSVAAAVPAPPSASGGGGVAPASFKDDAAAASVDGAPRQQPAWLIPALVGGAAILLLNNRRT